jgi:hypothetical protein
MFQSASLSVLFVAIYGLLFYSSANTPLQGATVRDYAEVASLALFISALAGFLLNILYRCICLILRLGAAGQLKLEKSVITLVLFFGFLLLVENWTYSLFSIGLKTGSPLFGKGAVAAVAIFLAYQVHGGVLKLGRMLRGPSPLLLFLVMILPAFMIWVQHNQLADQGNQSRQDSTNGPFYNVIVLSSDGINAADMSVYGNPRRNTPFLERKSGEFMIFERAFSNNGATTGALVAILTGMSPLATKVVYPPDMLTGANSTRTLPALLSTTKYLRSLRGLPHYVDANSQNMVGAFDTNNGRDTTEYTRALDSLGLSSIQRWYISRLNMDLLAVSKDVFLIEEMRNPFLQVDEQVGWQVKKWFDDESRLSGVLFDLGRARQGGKSLFVLAHFMASHGPYYMPQTRNFSAGLKQHKGWMEEFYADSILDFDGAIEQVYTRLEEMGQLDNTILVVTSDHGARWENQYRVPLLIRLPGAAYSGHYESNVQHLDIVPTVLQSLGKPIPQWLDGDSLLNASELPQDRLILVTTSNNDDNVRGATGMRRKNTNIEDFALTTRYMAIYCGQFAQSSFPINFEFKPLPEKFPGDNCTNRSLDQLRVLATEAVSKRLRENGSYPGAVH